MERSYSVDDFNVSSSMEEEYLPEDQKTSHLAESVELEYDNTSGSSPEVWAAAYKGVQALLQEGTNSPEFQEKLALV